MKRKTLGPISPNAGIEAIYQRKLVKIASEMHNSTIFWVLQTYKNKPPEMALDAWFDGLSPATALKSVMNRLWSHWEKEFSDFSTKVSGWFARNSLENVDKSMKSALKKSGMLVDWKFTREANDVLQSVIAENVSLIRSIPEKYLTDVNGLVMRHIQVGGSIESLADQLGPKIDLSLIRRSRKIDEDDKSFAARVRRRAILIATDQTNKANAAMTRMRQIEIGCNKALWLHSHAVRHPRKEHLAFDYHEYDIRKGAFLEGKWVWPGTEINCKCRSLTILPDKSILTGSE
jgi:uncharacterized protein with gpF-like domain